MKILSLNGTWQVRGATSDRGGLGDWPAPQRYMPSYDATVPGTVQEAFENITGDVHLGHNILSARFVEEQYWLYTRTITLCPGEIPDGWRARLVFEGLDLTAVIYVNGREVGRHNNFYTPCRIDVTEALRQGENDLAVRLESGLYSTIDKPTNTTYTVETGKMLKRVWCRQPQSSYEWDWSPRLLNVGIFKPCRLEIAPFFVDETSVTHTLNDDYSAATVRVRQFLTASAGRSVCVEARIAETGEGEVQTVAFGGEYVPLTFTVEHPKLWNPRGHGEPYRYTLQITVRDGETGEVVQTIDKKIGLRRVEIDQSPRPEGGNYFRLLINGVKLFAKGANMIPHDILFSRLTRDRYEVLIDRALENNFNMLRVWGGGVYETDDFYDLCDVNGIVVWQDFVNACATYPAFDREFFYNYLGEVKYNIRRLSAYASLVIYAGNNEIDQFMGWHDQLPWFTDASLYYVTLPRVLREEGDHHYYQPSSPWSPDGIAPTDFSVGDQHPWAIGFANRDYFQYRAMDCRFPNEGGILGPTSLPCMMAALSEGQEYLHSFDFKLHDNSICDRNVQAPEQLLTEKLGIELRRHGMPIPDYTYYGGFLQGEGLSEYILNFRRRMNDTTSSAIFWMYNDCWPATRSWTTIDYLRNRTPAFWAVKRCFAPVAVDIVKTADGEFDIYGVNEHLEKKGGKLTYGYMWPDGRASVLSEVQVSLVANNSCILAHLRVPAGAIPMAELAVEGEPTARRRFVETRYCDLGLVRSDIRVSIENGVATYECDTPVFGVCLDLDGDDGELSDNFFDLFPSRPYSVKLGSKSGKILYAYQG